MHRVLLTISLVLLATARVSAARPDGPPCTLGVYPFSPTSQALKTYAPVVAEFSRTLGRPVLFRTRPDAASFMAAVARGEFDLVFLHSFAYLRAHDAAGYLPLARFSTSLKVLVAVRADSPVSSLAELRNQVVGTGPIINPSSYLIRFALQREGMATGTGSVRLQPFERTFDCMQALLSDRVAACAGSPYVVAAFQARNHLPHALRVVHELGDYPDTLFAAHPRVSAEDRAKLMERILAWSQTEAGRALLQQTRFPPFVRARNSDYTVLRDVVKRVGKP